ncbi:NACHT, LRR and PYD domains-containing protein 12-like [Pelodytes ibericus]
MAASSSQGVSAKSRAYHNFCWCRLCCRLLHQSKEKEITQYADIGGSETLGDVLLDSLDNLSHRDFKRFKDKLSDFPYNGRNSIPRGKLETADTIATKNLLIDVYGDEAALDVTIQVYRSIHLMGPAEQLQQQIPHIGVRKNYMDSVKDKYQRIEERNARLGETVPLNSRYIELRMIKNHRDVEERQHEIVDNRSSDSTTTIEALFDPDEEGIIPKIVVLQGPAGIGKTMTAQKIMLDWASGNLYQKTFSYVFYLSCREINQITDMISISGVLSKICRLRCQRNLLTSILDDAEKILFIIDGFDELKVFLGSEAEIVEGNVFQETDIEIILTSLFQKRMLEKSSLLITTRPFTSEKLRECISKPRYVEILGFPGKNREEYFSNFFEKKEQADTVLNLIRTNNTLYTMCAVPIICWIICTVLNKPIKKGLNLSNYNTTTSIYMLYLKSLLKYHGRKSNLSVHSCMQRLTTLAKEGVWNQKIIFEEEDLEKHGLTVSDVESLFLNENIFQRDIETETCYTFIHLSVQEFFAALYYVLNDWVSQSEVLTLLKESEESPHLILTTRFLFGLYSEKQLKSIAEITRCKTSSGFKSVLQEWIKRRISASVFHNEILHCLCETEDEDFVKRMMSHLLSMEIDGLQHYFEERCLSYCLMNSEHRHKVDMHVCIMSKDTLKALIPGFHKCSKLTLYNCGLTSSCCEDLLSVFITNRSLIKLDLTNNDLQDLGVKRLCEGLRHPDCTLQELVLEQCYLTSSCCEDLRSAIITNRSLIKLDLSWNNLQDSGVKRLCKGLRNPGCTLRELGLGICSLTSSCCEDLRSVIITNRSLIKLDLTSNNLQDLGVKHLCEGLRHPDCTLQELRLFKCGLTSSCCENLLSVIITNRSLTQLDLSFNSLQDSGVKRLCEGLRHPDCTLRELRLDNCDLTTSCCEDLLSVIITNRSLTQLDFSQNDLQDSGVKRLCEGLRHPGCTLQELRLKACGLTSSCCEDLLSVIITNRSLMKMDLSRNNLQDLGVKYLCEGLRHPDCTLQKLMLNNCDLTSSCCEDLLSVIITNRSLTKLDLSENNLQDSGEQHLFEALRHPDCTLRELM